MNQPTEATWLQSKQHFHLLDGLRGVAAVGVVIYHYMEWVYPDFTQNFIGHGFLAVDFFFCLSGFVIGYAYDGRLSQMGLRQFFLSRLIRLHPLVVLGSVLGLLGLLADPIANHAAAYSAGYLALIFLMSLLLIPFPVMEERGFNLFNINPPAWSLFWEYIANIVYGLVLVRLPRRVLLMMLVPAAVGMVWVSQRAGNLMGGWSGGTFWDGGVRVAYSFLAGLIVYRFQWIVRNKLGFPVLAILLSATLVLPWFEQNWLAELVVVLLFFPLLVALGAGATVSGWTQKLCVWLGNLSYPLYMTHYVGIWWFGTYLTTSHPDSGTLPWIIGGGTVLMVLFAWLMMRVYDQPLRNYLTRKRKQNLAKGE